MKKTLVALLVSMAMVTTTVTGVFAADNEEPVHMTVACGLNETDATYAYFSSKLCEYVEEHSDGLFTYDLYTNGELMPLGKELEALESGTVDIVLSCIPQYFQSTFPLDSVTMLPAYQIDNVIASDTWQLMMESDRELADGKTFYDYEYTDKGYKTFAAPLCSDYHILTSGFNLQSVDQLNQSLRFRSSATTTELFAKNLGVSAVSMPASDVYDAMSRHSLEGIFYPGEWVSTSLWEVTDYVIKAKLGSAVTLVAMNLDTWNSLPVKVQEAFEEGAKELWGPATEGRTKTYEEAWEVMENHGAEIYELDDLDSDLKQAILDAGVATWYDWIDMTESAGAPGKEAAILWRDCLIEAGGAVADELMDLESYEPNSR